MDNQSQNSSLKNKCNQIKDVVLRIHRDRRTTITLFILTCILGVVVFGYKFVNSPVQEINNEMNSLLGFLIDISSNILAIAIMAVVYSLISKNTTLFNERYNWISKMNREAYSMLYNDMKKTDILIKLRSIKFGFLNDYPTDDIIAKKNRAFVRYVLKHDDLMYDYVICSVFNKKTFKALKKEVAEKYKLETEEDADIRVSLNAILSDNMLKNREKTAKLLAEWTTPPFICSQIAYKLGQGEKITYGKNCTYIFKAMMRCKVIDPDTTTYRDYITCLEKLKVLHPDMEIITSQGTITDNTPNPGNPVYEKLTEIINKEFFGK